VAGKRVVILVCLFLTLVLGAGPTASALRLSAREDVDAVEELKGEELAPPEDASLARAPRAPLPFLLATAERQRATRAPHLLRLGRPEPGHSCVTPLRC
jgi:hypothetical protein